jgi:hypothetical protein
MFKYSEIHNYQGEESVKQILVFPSQLLKDEFEKEFAQRVEKDGADKASDLNAGAIYKICAIKNHHDKWDGYIRCGHSGTVLVDQENIGDNWDFAIASMANIFAGYIKESCNRLFDSVLKQIQ